MHTYARISDGAVAELLHTDADPQTLFHPSVFWVSVNATDTPQGLAVGWLHSPSGFQAPPAPSRANPPTLTELRARLAELAAELERHG